MSHYFSSEAHSTSQVRSFTVSLQGKEFHAQTDIGVFSTTKLDPGTKVLLEAVPAPPRSGTFLDIGCGWGPITMALAAASPQARIVGVDINPRAIELTNTNLDANKLTNANAYATDTFLAQEPSTTFEVIWSNPPIRVGKSVLHEIMRTWLPRLSATGVAYIVANKNLGGDSLHKWLQNQMDLKVQRIRSKQGYRVLQIHPR